MIFTRYTFLPSPPLPGYFLERHIHPSIFFLNTTGSAYEAIPGGAAGDGGSGQARKGGGILDREGYDQL